MPQVKREALERALQGYLAVIPQEHGYIVVFPEYEYVTIIEVPSREELEELLRGRRFRGVRGLCTTIGRRFECYEAEVEGRVLLEALYVLEAY